MILRHDTRTPAPQKSGKPQVTYPYGDLRFPRIVETRTAKKGQGNGLVPYLTPHRDQHSFPGAVLIAQQSDPGDDTDKNVTETYEVLPGPIFVEVSTDQDTGIPILVSRQKRAANDFFTEGEITPTSLVILSISAGNPCTVALNTPAHLLSPRMWVTFSGTGTPLDGRQRILGVPAENQLSFAVNVTSAVSGGSATMTPLNHVDRELKSTDNANICVKVDSAIAVPDVTTYNEDIAAWKEYSFPDYLRNLFTYASMAESENEGSSYGYSWTAGASYGMDIQNGYRGPCRARRKRVYSMGPVTDSVVGEYTPTFMMPSSGTVVVRSMSVNYQASPENYGQGTSYTYKTGTIPPVITSGGFLDVGSGQASVDVVLGASHPTSWAAGDTITLLEQPQKLRCGLWQLYVWVITIPYTSGEAPP